jgi:hypothetical protein
MRGKVEAVPRVENWYTLELSEKDFEERKLT